MIEFNSRGYISPANVVETDFETFEQVFVFNEHRKFIFDEYLLFLETLKKLDIGAYFQWINGSFTTKKPHPNDIDVVTFVDYEFKERHQKLLYSFKSELLKLGIDCYFVVTYPDNHPEYFNSKADELDFFHKFVRDWKQERRSGMKLNKGFIKLNFE